jgi:hypothetical protein
MEIDEFFRNLSTEPSTLTPEKASGDGICRQTNKSKSQHIVGPPPPFSRSATVNMKKDPNSMMASPVLHPSTPPSFSRDISALCLSELAIPSSADPTPPIPDDAISPPPHRSHDPRNNLKRTDPFQFGSRYLLENDDVFEFNAWDHVETDDAYKDYAEAQYAAQRESPVSDFDKRTQASCLFPPGIG